jgi:tetratricopeptide (TPR) repeat protein
VPNPTRLSFPSDRLWASWPTDHGPTGQGDVDLSDRDLPILDAGGARTPTAEDLALLRSHPAHPVLADRPPTVLPYTRQDRYDRRPSAHATRVAVLENDHLRAEFLLELGGRLWSLVDRHSGRELLHRPATLQPANLALRNAWFAGGVEWNLGFTGHWALTCEPVYAGWLTAPDGTPVLRLWEYERMLGLTWRIDVWLPSDARTLLIRPVIDNPTTEPVAVYWWSNIAVPLTTGTRVLAPARNAWHFGYSGQLQYVSVDDATSYPATAPHSADYFFDIEPDTDRPWICAVDADGYGLVQASTSRLRGRKLFVWGERAGGRHWQRWLGDDQGYAEIQAGLARTQLEHLPLPPGHRWAWTEAYGPLTAPAAATAAWDQAVQAAGRAARQASADAIADGERVLTALTDTPPEQICHMASGWGALEVAVGHRDPDPATPYPAESLGENERAWLDLVQTGRLDSITAPPVVGEGWTQRLTAAAPDAAMLYHAGLAALARGEPDQALAAWRRGLEYRRHPLILRALGSVEHQRGADTVAADHYAAAADLAREHVGIAVEAMTVLCDVGQPHRAEIILHRLSDPARQLGRVRYLACRAALDLGDLETVRRLLVDQHLLVPDVREGDEGLEALWRAYCAAAGEDRALPRAYDFRMHANQADHC